jgi:hypothetical protein
MTHAVRGVERTVRYNRLVCTLTWHDTSDGYRLFFNRDERSERKPEIAPAIRCVDKTRFIAPLDGDHHGTWIAVNEHGLSVCLLNGFSARGLTEHPAYTTRGRLPLGAVAKHSATAVDEWLRTVELDVYRPFILVVFELAGAGLVAAWSGVSLEIRPGRPHEQPLISSSFYTEQVRTSRGAVFARLVVAGAEPAAAHRAFHRSHLPTVGPYSPCMHRDDASTVSFSQIEVDSRQVRLHHASNAPCEGLPAEPACVLERRGATGSLIDDRAPGAAQ